MMVKKDHAHNRHELPLVLNPSGQINPAFSSCPRLVINEVLRCKRGGLIVLAPDCRSLSKMCLVCIKPNVNLTVYLTQKHTFDYIWPVGPKDSKIQNDCSNIFPWYKEEISIICTMTIHGFPKPSGVVTQVAGTS